jgi:high affinity sulfate transporter 1
MRPITNDYKDAQILNLGSEGEHGPYLVTQTGVAPSDPRLKTRMFVLRPDGRWVDFNAYACQGNPEAMDEIVFPSIPKIIETFGRLFGGPRVLDLPIDEAGLNAWVERHNNDPLQAVRAWVAQYKERRRKEPRRLKRAVTSARDEMVAVSSSSLARWIPALTWLRAYNQSWLRGDVLAGITLAAYLLPAALGDASLANLPPEAGLYACLFGGLVFWIFCSSRYTAVSITSAISLVVGSSLGEITGGNTARFSALAAGTALLVSLIALIAWIAQAGVLVHFISESVMTGFKCGVALFLASTQLPKLFGFHGAHGSFWENSGFVFRHLNEINSTSLLIGGIALTGLVLGKIFLKHKPVALFVVVGGIAAASVLSLETRGVKLLGSVPQGIPPLRLPAVYWNDLTELLPLAFACFLLGAVETAAIGRMFVAKHAGRFNANQENLALAASNLFAGLGGGFPVSGGTSQSLVNEEGGARTPLSGALAAVVILVVVLFFSHLLSTLPQPVLAAIVLVAVASLFNLSTLTQLWRDDRPEFVVAVAAFVGVLTFGLLRGVMIGAAISLVQLVHASSHPHIGLLGRIPGTRRFSDCERHPDNELIPNVLIFRPEAGLVYFNVDYVCETILNRVYAEPTLPRLVVLDLSAAARVDMQSAHTLAAMADELSTKGIQFHAVEPRSSVRDRLRHEGVDAKLGGVNRFATVADVIDEFQRETSNTLSNSGRASSS